MLFLKFSRDGFTQSHLFPGQELVIGLQGSETVDNPRIHILLVSLHFFLGRQSSFDAGSLDLANDHGSGRLCHNDESCSKSTGATSGPGLLD